MIAQRCSRVSWESHRGWCDWSVNIGTLAPQLTALGIFSFGLLVVEASTFWDIYFRKMSKCLLEGGKRGALS